MARNPLVVILGSTGTGKSKLAIQLAKRYGGEVISADSMQVYKGLDVITNKVTVEEAEGVVHHMLDILEPPARFTVVDFRNKALPIINDLQKRGVVPIVVGGTNYYIESLVWKVLVEDEYQSSESDSMQEQDGVGQLIMSKYPYEDILKVACTLLKTRYLLDVVEFAEKVFLAYLQFRIDAMPRFHDVIGDLLDSPANFSDSLLIHKATDVLDEIADYELGSILMCTRYRWIMNDFRNVEKVLLDFVSSLYKLVDELLVKKKRCLNTNTYFLKCEKKDSLEEELIGTFRNLHKGPCLENIEFSVSDHPIPAEYALLSLRLDELKNNNCYTEIRRAMSIVDRVVPTLDYPGLAELSSDVYAFARFSQEELLPRLLKIVDAESLRVGLPPEKIPTLPSDKEPLALHELLKRLDPEMACTLHPNDTRKVLRSVQVCLQKGRKHSEIIAEQKTSGGGSSLGGPLRFENTAILWLQCQQDILEKRIDDRVDDMMARGLLNELTDFYNKYNTEVNRTLDSNNDSEISDLRPVYTQGIFQSIGFKEFDSYLKLNEEERSLDKGCKLLEEGLAGLRLATKRYAKRQNKWVNQRFINTPDRHVPPVYALQTSAPLLWDSRVLAPACAVVSDLLGLSPENIPPPDPIPRPNQISSESEPPIDNKSHHFCETCSRVFIGDIQWNAHIKSKKHQKVTRKKQQLNAICKKEKTENIPEILNKPSTSELG